MIIGEIGHSCVPIVTFRRGKPDGSARGRTMRRAGFTLVEMLVGVVFIVLVAMIAIPYVRGKQARAKITVLAFDLRDLAQAEKAYQRDHGSYTASLSSLKSQTSPGVVVTITNATASGWSAIATDPRVAPLTCAVFTGSVAAQAPAKREGEIACQ
jgi:type II secretory pathway pseudopilin PulG